MAKDVDVVIVGAGLTGLSLAFYLQKKGRKVVLLDKNNRVGGVINTLNEDGFTYEIGPNTGVLSSVELVSLFNDLEGSCELDIANPDSKKRWIWKDNRWQALPAGLVQSVTTPLFTFSDKLRILGEPFRKKGTIPNESVASMVKRRLGRSFLDYAVDPFISGIYAGDPERLVTRFALPKLYHLEQDYGSFIRGAIKKAKQAKTELDKQVTREVFSVKGGLSKLTDALASKIGSENIVLECENLKIDHLAENSFKVNYSQQAHEGESIHAKHIVSTTGAYALNSFLAFLSKEDLAPIENLRYAKVNQVVLGYKSWDGLALDAFGGLIPSKENRQVLGILFPASIFAKRAPEGGALLSVFMGGVKNEEQTKLSDKELLAIALQEVQITLKTSKQPDLIKINRYEKAIAQYEASSEQRLLQIEILENKFQGLHLAGNICGGIGMSDRVVQAVQLSKQL